MIPCIIKSDIKTPEEIHSLDRKLQGYQVYIPLFMAPKIAAVPTMEKMIILNTIPIKYQIRVALAQFALLGCVSDPKPQTNSIISPTKGMAVIKMVIIQSFTLIGW